MGVKHIYTSAYNSQNNGLCERQNATTKTTSRAYIEHEDQEKLDLSLQALWSINTTPQDTTRRTPFELVLARRPIQSFDLTLPSVDNTP